jgi:hypothetical protein
MDGSSSVSESDTNSGMPSTLDIQPRNTADKSLETPPPGLIQPGVDQTTTRRLIHSASGLIHPVDQSSRGRADPGHRIDPPRRGSIQGWINPPPGWIDPGSGSIQHLLGGGSIQGEVR